MTCEIICLSGPSGVGKSTILNRVLPEFPHIVFSVSATTREPRPGEVHGVNYYFWSREKFELYIKAGAFLEYAEVFGNYYGTPLGPIEDQVETGKIVLLDIDPQGVRQIQAKNMSTVLYVAVLPPSREELERRLRGRSTENEETIQKRMATYDDYAEVTKDFDHRLLNDDLEMAVVAMRSLLGGLTPRHPA
jgi:guanylate kinase